MDFLTPHEQQDRRWLELELEALATMAALYRQAGLITPDEQEEIGNHLLVQYCERLTDMNDFVAARGDPSDAWAPNFVEQLRQQVSGPDGESWDATVARREALVNRFAADLVTRAYDVGLIDARLHNHYMERASPGFAEAAAERLNLLKAVDGPQDLDNPAYQPLTDEEHDTLAFDAKMRRSGKRPNDWRVAAEKGPHDDIVQVTDAEAIKWKADQERGRERRLAEAERREAARMGLDRTYDNGTTVIGEPYLVRQSSAEPASPSAGA